MITVHNTYVRRKKNYPFCISQTEMQERYIIFIHCQYNLSVASLQVSISIIQMIHKNQIRHVYNCNSSLEIVNKYKYYVAFLRRYDTETFANICKHVLFRYGSKLSDVLYGIE